MKTRKIAAFGLSVFLLPLAIYASSVGENGMYHFTEGEVIDPDEVNSNFDYFANDISVSSGKVGIGTRSPQADLHVAGSIRSDAGYPFIAGTSGYIYYPNLSSHVAWTKKNGDYHYYWRRSDSGYPDGTEVTLMQLTDWGLLWLAGGVGIQSAGYAAVELQGNSGAYIDLKVDPNADYEGRILASSGALYFSTTMPNAFYIGPATQWGSLLGIGTTEPSQKLHVIGNVYADDYLTYSDVRLKTDIQPIEDAAERVACLQGVTYRWKEQRSNDDVMLGLIAQEVEECFPEVVTLNADGYKSVAYDRLVAPLVEAAKEQQIRTRELEAALQEQQRVNAVERQRLEARLSTLEARLARLEAQEAGQVTPARR